MNSNGKRSIVLASLALPVALIISGSIGWYLKTHNPDNVNITSGLAYIRPILGSALISFGAFMLAAFLCALRGLRRDTSRDLSVLGLSLIVVLTVLSITAGITHKGGGDAEDAYRTEKTQQFFNALQR